ncbi:MAG TPA: c-type cytochrome [Gemmatimonadaceae bacterium]|nr:c-type cytochrome [Gemmatimonadaceae bacterium]
MLACVLAGAVIGGCSRDDDPQLIPSAGMTQQGTPVRTSTLRAGATVVDVAARNPYEGDDRAVAEGRRLYGEMNCLGCHGGAGGGGMGPPFADAEWIYGSNPENIVQSILQGRPNGMPAFGGKLPESEAWKVAAFVRSLDKTAASPEAGTGQAGSRKGQTEGER